ncbi:hypothetical protein [Planktothrix agardhii]|uniref:hypothetical protein n=1 Tax=Planktothrix agardhii TaxID=1160 RepID=UPI0004886B95|nr:hypothetical protein [Planktothrix agardhii]
MSSNKDDDLLERMRHNAHLAHAGHQLNHQMKHTQQQFSAPKPSLTLNQLPSASLKSLLGGFGGFGGC